ncbi:MAG: hypothetical protein ACPG7F_17750 [Aggregatilineales bacterium]
MEKLILPLTITLIGAIVGGLIGITPYILDRLEVIDSPPPPTRRQPTQTASTDIPPKMTIASTFTSVPTRTSINPTSTPNPFQTFSGTPTSCESSGTISAPVANSNCIQNVEVVHNSFKNSVKGMTILIDFIVSGSDGEEGEIAAYFYYQNGNLLRDFNNRYASIDGQVSTGQTFILCCSTTTYQDFELFLPYNELHMDRGESNLKFHIDIFINNTSIAHSSDITFNFTQD